MRSGAGDGRCGAAVRRAARARPRAAGRPGRCRGARAAWRSSSQPTAESPAGPEDMTPTGGPQASRSRMARATSGASSMRIGSAARSARWTPAPRVAAPGRGRRAPPRTGPAPPGSCGRRGSRLPRARPGPVPTGPPRGPGRRTAPSRPRRGAAGRHPLSRAPPSPATTSASRTCRRPASSASTARCTLALVEARAARLVRSAGRDARGRAARAPARRAPGRHAPDIVGQAAGRPHLPTVDGHPPNLCGPLAWSHERFFPEPVRPSFARPRRHPPGSSGRSDMAPSRRRWSRSAAACAP